MKWFLVQLVGVFVCSVVEIMFDIVFEKIKTSFVARQQIAQIILVHTNEEFTIKLGRTD
jgi:hypothetical protein